MEESRPRRDSSGSDRPGSSWNNKKRNIPEVQEEHRILLAGLHNEVDTLKKKNKGILYSI